MSGSPPCRDEVAGEGWSDKGGWISGGTHDRDPTKAEVLWPDRCWGIPLGCERSLHSSRTKRTSPCLPPLIAPCEIRLESLSFLFSNTERCRKLQGATRIVSSNEIPYARFTRKKRNRPINFITFDRHRIYPIPLIGNSHRRKISPRNRRPDELFPSIERGQNTISFCIRGII